MNDVIELANPTFNLLSREKEQEVGVKGTASRRSLKVIFSFDFAVYFIFLVCQR
jgi:hypothetical protein